MIARTLIQLTKLAMWLGTWDNTLFVDNIMGNPEIFVTSTQDFREPVREMGADGFFLLPDDQEAISDWSAQQEGKVVVVVNDSDIVREVLKRELELGGAIVHEFGDPFEALQEIPNLNPDVVVTDVIMPGMSGAELVRELRRLYPPEA